MHATAKIFMLAAMAASALAAHKTSAHCSTYSTTVEWWPPTVPTPPGGCLDPDSPLCPSYDCAGEPTKCASGSGLFTPPMPSPTTAVTTITGKDCSVTVNVDLGWATCGCTTCAVCANTVYH